jgi:class 3 adenylate cyclase
MASSQHSILEAFLQRFMRADALDGVLALLVTDLEGFTTLVERLGDARSQAIIRRHNRALRRCIRDRRGREVTHTGDGIVAAFRSIASALQCARDMQHTLHSYSREFPNAPLRARMGLHAGEPLPEDGRLFGHCVNVAFRVCAQAPAGSVLVTQVVKQLAQGHAVFEPGRAYTLKGVTGPFQLFEYAWQAPALNSDKLRVS